jgi:DNA (cytosine-5)-methyltransferase 1
MDGDRLTAVSLFCGCGGLDVGMEGDFDFLGRHYADNGIDVIYSNEIDARAARFYELNFGRAPDCRDIRTVDSDDIPDADILTGGFPCQSFTIAAEKEKRLGIKDERGQLFFEMSRIIREKQPKCFVAENVVGLLTANDSEAFPLIMSEFRSCGYRPVCTVMDSSYYGVPQKRERVIIVGMRDDLPFDFEFSTLQFSKKKVPLRAVLEDDVPEKYRYSPESVSRARKGRKMKCRVQDIDEPCATIPSHICKTSLNSTDPVLMTDGGYRRFTPREIARIQSFPDSYVLAGRDVYQYHALGNAVPPVMAWHIFNRIGRMLRKGDGSARGTHLRSGCPDRHYFKP